MIALSLFLKNVAGWVIAHWRLVAGVVGVFLLVIVVAIAFRSCNKPPKLDEAEIQKGEQAVRERNDKVLREILTNSLVEEKQIEANVTNAKAETVNAIAEAKEKYSNMNTNDLAAELERRK